MRLVPEAELQQPMTNGVHQNYQAVEEGNAAIPEALLVVHAEPVATSTDNEDQLIHYRRYLTYDELRFAWNAVIAFILGVIGVMIFVTILLVSMYGKALLFGEKSYHGVRLV